MVEPPPGLATMVSLPRVICDATAAPPATLIIGIVLPLLKFVPPPLAFNHCTPKSVPSPSNTSTIMASTNTWARRISSWRNTSSNERIISGWAVITSELLSACASMLIARPGLAAPRPAWPPGAVPPWTSATIDSLTPFNTGTSSSALAYFK